LGKKNGGDAKYGCPLSPTFKNEVRKKKNDPWNRDESSNGPLVIQRGKIGRKSLKLKRKNINVS